MIAASSSHPPSSLRISDMLAHSQHAARLKVRDQRAANGNNRCQDRAGHYRHSHQGCVQHITPGNLPHLIWQAGVDGLLISVAESHRLFESAASILERECKRPVYRLKGILRRGSATCRPQGAQTIEIRPHGQSAPSLHQDCRLDPRRRAPMLCSGQRSQRPNCASQRHKLL